MVVRLLILVGLQTTEYRQLWMLSRVEWSISTHICQWWVRLMLIDAFIWSLECGNIGKSSISPLPPGGLSYSSVRHWWNGCVHANIPNGCVQSGYNTRINLFDRDQSLHCWNCMRSMSIAHSSIIHRSRNSASLVIVCVYLHAPNIVNNGKINNWMSINMGSILCNYFLHRSANRIRPHFFLPWTNRRNKTKKKRPQRRD